MKLNSDGAFHKQRKDGDWGHVIRDDQGRVTKAEFGYVGSLLDAFYAELLGYTAGLQEVARMGIANLCIETDASLVKAALDSDDHGLSNGQRQYSRDEAPLSYRFSF